MWHGSLAGRSRPALLMLPRFADIFQQGNHWLNWLEKQPERAVRP
ncbi:IS91 family transposase, partial [Escherichia coli]|nr:IS91 family transposase [Escherichia coli]